MRFLTNIRDRQFAKKWGGAYNLSRAVLAGVLAAGCLMPGFAEAADLVTNLPDNVYKQSGNTATITKDIGNAGDTRKIYWASNNGEASVEGCTINVNPITIEPNINIYGGRSLSSGNVTGNAVIIKDTTFNNEASIYGGYSKYGNANENSVSISGDGTFKDDVSGGFSRDGTANYNQVIISGGKFGSYVSGGESYSGTANYNQVIISGGTFSGGIYAGVYGGWADSNSSTANKNRVIISGDGTFKTDVSGGFSYDGTADENRVIISGGKFNGGVFGGESNFGTANKNSVIISGGTFSGGTTNDSVYCVYGGYGDTANGNSVIISSGTFSIDKSVYGGYGNTAADGNSVIISGGEFNGVVFGGFAESNSGTANNNKVILVGKNATYKFTDTQGTEQTLTGSGNINIDGTVYGGRVNSGTPSGNELHVYGSNTKVGRIAEFNNLNFYINHKMTYGDVMLTITGDSDIDISVSNVIVNVDGAPKAKGDLNTITLIQKTDVNDGSIIVAPNNDNITVNFGPVLTGTGTVALTEDQKDLVLTLKNITVNENGKSLVETRAAAAFVVNNMSDFMLGTGMEQAKAAAGGVTPIDAGTMAPFAAVGGSNMRYTTGSYVDVNGWNGAVGFAKQADKLLFGVAVEHGRGNYDSYLDSGVHASGDIKSTGGVIFGEYKLDNGVHYDAALRAGRVKSDYNSTATSYDKSSAYYGFSLGGGKELTVSDKATLDVYGRYYFSHTNGSDVSIATGEEIDFDAVNSHRLRIGGRYTTTLTEKSKAYAGLAWQYEFGGDAKAAINGCSAPAPSLQGHSAIVEAGYKLNAGKNLTLDFNLNGAMGKQRGIGGGIGAQWLF